MITYKFTNTAGVDIEVLTDGQGDATNELHVVEIRGAKTTDVKGGFDFDVYPYNEVEFEIFAKANNLTLRKFEDENEADGSPMYEATGRELKYTAIDSVTSILPVTVTYSAGKFTIPEDVVSFTFTDDFNAEAEFDGWEWNIEKEVTEVYVPYTAIDTVAAIDPVTVTFANSTFTIPIEVESFTFKDDGKTFNAAFDGWAWSIEEQA